MTQELLRKRQSQSRNIGSGWKIASTTGFWLDPGNCCLEPACWCPSRPSAGVNDSRAHEHNAKPAEQLTRVVWSVGLSQQADDLVSRNRPKWCRTVEFSQLIKNELVCRPGCPLPVSLRGFALCLHCLTSKGSTCSFLQKKVVLVHVPSYCVLSIHSILTTPSRHGNLC